MMSAFLALVGTSIPLDSAIAFSSETVKEAKDLTSLASSAYACSLASAIAFKRFL